MKKAHRIAKQLNPILTAIYCVLKIVLLVTATLTAQPIASQTDRLSSCPGWRASGPVFRFSGLSSVQDDTTCMPGDPPDRPATNG